MDQFVPIPHPGASAGFPATSFRPVPVVSPKPVASTTESYSAFPSETSDYMYNYRDVNNDEVEGDYYDYSGTYSDYVIPPSLEKLYKRPFRREKLPKHHYSDRDRPMGNRIRGIRNNDAIFRQGSSDLSWVAGLAANAIKIFSLLTSFGGGSDDSDSSGSSPDRIDTNTVAGATAAADDIDIAIATLSSYGGKYLRKMAFWAWEHATATPSNSIPEAPPTASTTTTTTESVDSISNKVGSVASVVTSTSTKAPGKRKSPLQELSPEELEKLGLEAVGAGAEPTKLQQAFASAQISGDWTSLENEIVNALGEDALPKPEPSNPIEAIGNLISSAQEAVNPTSSPTSSSSSTSSSSTGGGLMSTILKQASSLVNGFVGSGSSGAQGVDKIGEAAETGGATAAAEPEGFVQTFMTKMDRVVNGGAAPASATKPGTLVASGALQDSMITRFINEFELQQEALALQNSVNKLISTVNTFMGDDEDGDSDGSNVSSVNKIGVAAGESSTSSSSSGGVINALASIPAGIVSSVVSGLKFLAPGTPTAENKIGADGLETFSEVDQFNPVNSVALAGLGTAAIGSVLWTVYVSSVENRRRQGRSPRDPKMLELGQHFYSGKP
eukprot:TCALIF_09443-PA protein Name:"Protein of unknown function" AED:0.03 eAED:0.03 QI:241/1/0.5/1/1/1/2/0/612